MKAPEVITLKPFAGVVIVVIPLEGNWVVTSLLDPIPTHFLPTSSTSLRRAGFGFPGDFQTFSPQRLFTAVNSNITDVLFFVPGTNIAATTSAFGAIFVDVEVAGLTKMEFFDASNLLIYSRDVLVAGNQGLSFLGAVAGGGGSIGRVRITSGLNTIVSNSVLGNPIDDVVVMDDFLFGEPARLVPEPSSLALVGLGLLCFMTRSLRRRQAA